MQFRHEQIDSNPPASRLSSCLTTDLTGNGRPDIITGALGGSGAYGDLMRVVMKRVLPYFETNIFWYENPGWERYTLAEESDLHLGVGAALGDIDRDGKIDLVVGQGWGRSNVYWYEQPADPREPWTQHLLTDRFQKYHDLVIGDIDDDGEAEVVGASQESEAIFYYDIPDDPTVEPWPADHLHVIDDDLNIEGLLIVDIDGDGSTELLAGPYIYHQPAATDDSWRKEPIAPEWERTRIGVADLDGDGELEFVASEGDSPYLGTHPARVAWFDPPDWEQHLLADELFCPHSLQVEDLTGDGRPDIYTAEMGLGEQDNPRHFVFENTGGGTFEKHVIDTGVPTHEATVVDLNNDDSPDIVGHSYEPDVHVDAWFNEM